MRKLLILPILATTLILFSFSTSNFYGMIRHDVDIEKYREISRQMYLDRVVRYSISETDEDYAVGVLTAS